MSKKKSAVVVPAASITPAANIRILKVATCKSLSAKSDLTYHVGHIIAEEEAGASDYNIHFRVYANSSPGYFSQEWVPMSSIQQVFDKVPAGQPISSFALFPIFKGRSQNTPGFLLAALHHEGFLRHMREQQRCYELIDASGFMAEMVKLIDAGVDLRVQSKVVLEKSASKKSKASTVPVGAVPAMPDDASQEQAGN